MKSVLFMLQDQINNFSKSEQKVAKYMINHTQAVLSMNAEEIAKQSSVSPATVVRLAKEISSEGLPGVKLQLASEIKVDRKLYSEINPRDSVETVKGKMELRIGHTIEQTNTKLSNESLVTASHLLHAADTLYVYGLGASNIVAADVQQKFIRIGKAVIQTLDTHLIASGLSQEKTVLILISNSGMTIEAQQLASAAQSVNVPIITITGNPKAKLAQQSNVILQHDSSEENVQLRSAATTSLMAQLYVVDMMYYTYITKSFDTSVDKLQQSKKLIDQWFKQSI